MKNKFKDYSFWTGLAGAIVVFVQVLGRIFGFIPNNELVNDIVMSIAGILVVFGVVSAPSKNGDNDNKDDKEWKNIFNAYFVVLSFKKSRICDFFC